MSVSVLLSQGLTPTHRTPSRTLRDRSILNPTLHPTDHTFLHIPPSRHTECFCVSIYFHQHGINYLKFHPFASMWSTLAENAHVSFRTSSGPRTSYPVATRLPSPSSREKGRLSFNVGFRSEQNGEESNTRTDGFLSPTPIAPDQYIFLAATRDGITNVIADTGGYSYQTLLPPVPPKV